MRQNISSNSPFEDIAGYSRAVRVGDLVFVAGTTGWGSDGRIIEGGAYEQAVQCIDNINVALHKAGASLADVVRTRLYVTDITAADQVTRAHKEAFGDVRPAATLVEVRALATKEMLVEIEADAVIDTSRL